MDAYRRLEDLTLMDDYMFGTVMRDPKLIRPLIESILDMRIRRVTYIEPQRTINTLLNLKYDICGRLFRSGCASLQSTMRRAVLTQRASDWICMLRMRTASCTT